MLHAEKKEYDEHQQIDAFRHALKTNQLAGGRPNLDSSQQDEKAQCKSYSATEPPWLWQCARRHIRAIRQTRHLDIVFRF